MTPWITRLSSVFTALAVFFVWVLFGWVAKRLVFRRLKVWSSKIHFIWGDIFVISLESPVHWLILASGLAIFVSLLPLSGTADTLTAIAFKGSVIFSIVLFADNLIRNFSTHGLWAPKAAGAMSSGVIQGLLRGFVIGLGVLIFLQLIGISITPILASLGIGSLAVALALQETLSNFFAGIYVSIDKPVQAGDFIRLESGDEGCVSDVGWRSTRIRTGANNIVIIPNSKLIGSVLTNYSLPTREIAVPVEITVADGSDLGLVEKAVLQTAASLSTEILGIAKGSEPAFHFHSFGELGIRGTAVLKAREFSDAGPVKHAFVKALQARFKKEGIEVPYRTKF